MAKNRAQGGLSPSVAFIDEVGICPRPSKRRPRNGVCQHCALNCAAHECEGQDQYHHQHQSQLYQTVQPHLRNQGTRCCQLLCSVCLVCGFCLSKQQERGALETIPEGTIIPFNNGLVGRRARARLYARDRAQVEEQRRNRDSSRSDRSRPSDEACAAFDQAAANNPSTGGCCSSPLRRPMASTASLGGSDRNGGEGGAPGGQRIVPPSGEGRGGGRGRVVDGRGGGGTGGDGETMPLNSKEWEWDMDACCRKICTILKEDCKVGPFGRRGTGGGAGAGGSIL